MNKILLAIALSLMLTACSSSNLDDVKKHASQTFEQAGFDIVGYEGYELGISTLGTNYGGAYVWYTLKRKDNGLIYEASIQRWGNEYHIYDIKAIDALSNKN